ncbi:lipocalin family protein [Aquabacterium sp. J223]|uniref:lipocalin family protein n=1 Tax=Aquabacterium sp. J223 TaxID=2898431 RepID=UPI0021ADF8CF|nr:lipocalin family protein [Aquabacterium sp. J223]UUX94268.1 lipocalin family protein [Aquabacterium sp. J223]
MNARQLRQEIEAARAEIAAQDERLSVSWSVLKQSGASAAKRKLLAGGVALAVGLVLRPARGAGRVPRSGWRRYGRFAAPLLKTGLPVLLPLITPLLDRRATSLMSRVGLPVGGPVDPPLHGVDTLPDTQWEGTWHEWAFLPTREHHDTDVRWTLRPVADDSADRGTTADPPPPTWDIVVEGIDGAGREQRTQGRCRRPDPAQPGLMQTSFAAPALQFLPLAWHDEVVLHVAPEGDVLVIGTPDRQRLWVLGRGPVLDEARWPALLEIAAAQGFEVDRLRRAASAPAAAALPADLPPATATPAESAYLPDAVPPAASTPASPAPRRSEPGGRPTPFSAVAGREARPGFLLRRFRRRLLAAAHGFALFDLLDGWSVLRCPVAAVLRQRRGARHPAARRLGGGLEDEVSVERLSVHGHLLGVVSLQRQPRCRGPGATARHGGCPCRSTVIAPQEGS